MSNWLRNFNFGLKCLSLQRFVHEATMKLIIGELA